MERNDSLTAVEEMTSPPSPKRPRTDHAEADIGKSTFDFPEPLTFCKPGFTLQSTSLACVETLPLQTTHMQDQLSLQADSTMEIKTSKFSITDITETDRLILNMLYDSEGAATVSQATADTSSHDGSQLGKSVQCEPPVGLSASGRDVEDGARQVQSSGSPIQPVTLTRAEEDVRCQADCSHEEAALDEGTDMQNRALVAFEESNQREIQCEFRKKSLCNKETEDVKTSLSFSHFADGKSFSTKLAVCPSGSLAEVGENNGETLELQNVVSCDGKTEERFNDGRKLSFSDAGAVVTLTENMNTFHAKEGEAKKQQTVEELIAKVEMQTADTAETRASISISQIVTEGDNDAASFSVIDRAFLTEADRPAEENRNAGFELSEKVCKNEGDLIVGTKELQTVNLPGPEQTGQSPFQSRAQPQYDKDVLSNMETVTSITDDKTGDKSDIENHRRPTSPRSSSSATSHSAEDQRGGSKVTVGDELKERDQSGSLSGSLDHPEAPTQGDTARMDKKSETQEASVVSTNCTNGFWLDNLVQQQNIHHDTTEILLCKSWNGFAGHTGSRHITSEEVNTYKESAVEGRDAGERINGPQKTSVASEQREASLAEVQLPACNILKTETCVMLDSEENEKNLDESELAQIENMDESNETICSALNVNITGVVESQGENAMTGDTLHEEPPPHNANIANLLPPESCQTICNTQKPASEEKTCEETLNPKTCAAKSNNHFPMTCPTSSDAVVPGINNFGVDSQLTDHNSVSPYNCNVRFSLAPSAPAFTIRATAGGFDTFEKIQLSPDDDDVDASGLGNDTLLTSPPRQLLGKQLHPVGEVESDVSNNAYGFLSSNSTRAVVASPVPTADVIARGWPDQKPRCESTFQIYDCFLDSAAVSIESDSSECGGSDGREFEMKKQFDTVLKELKLFFDISASDMASSNGTSSPEPLRVIIEALEGDASKCKDREESAEEADTRETSLDDTDEDRSLECEAAGSGAKSCEGEQEVPLGTYGHQEAPGRSELKETEPAEREQRQRTWSPSFMSRPLMEQLTQKLLEPPRRLEPLRTCTRPIRVGLSKRAKTGQLHHPHPYK